MAFTVDDYHDLVRLLVEHPEWKEELRRTLLSDELLALPEIVRELVEAQRRTEERLDALTETVNELATAQRRTEERLDVLTETVNELATAQRRTEERLDALAEAQSHLTETVLGLVKRVDKLENTVGGLKGQMLEMAYRDRAFAYFGRILRRVKVMPIQTLEDTLEAALTSDEFNDLLLLDLLVTGKVRHALESPEIWLAVEISAMVDRHDVDRALRRANLLRQAGHRAVPVVAGEAVTKGGEVAAQAQNVALVQDGRVAFWKEAVAVWENIQLVED